MTSEILSERLVLRSMPEAFLQASLRGDVQAADAVLGLRTHPDWFLESDLMELRLGDLAADPHYRDWSLRAIGLRNTGEMLGHIGFHTRPNAAYLRNIAPDAVELGYTVFAPHRMRGYAQEALGAMLEWAASAHGVPRFVLSIAPENLGSRGVATKLGFARRSAWMEAEDGVEELWVREAPLVRQPRRRATVAPTPIRPASSIA